MHNDNVYQIVHIVKGHARIHIYVHTMAAKILVAFGFSHRQLCNCCICVYIALVRRGKISDIHKARN
jgi:hypothetical protein